MFIQKILNKIKEIFGKVNNTIEENPKYRDFVDNVMPFLKFGDIIYAERFNDDREKEIMGDGHTTGPFIVISFDEDKIVGAYCTSNPNVKDGFQVGGYYNLFNREKNSYASLSYLKTIDAEAYLNKHTKSLSMIDINRLKKKLCLANKQYKYDDFYLQKDLNIDFNVEFEAGDVVSYEGHTYLIVEKKENDKFVVIPITDYDYCSSLVNFSEVKIEYSNVKEVEKSSIVYLNTILKPQMAIIMNNYDNYISKKNAIINSDIKTLERGCLISVSDGLYYVFGIEGNIANTFAVKKTELIDDIIPILGEKYMPCYEIIKNIDIKKDSYQILGLASEMEMEKIKESKKSYKKTKKEFSSNKKTNEDSKISCKLLVCLKDNIMSRYIIYKEFDNDYYLISLSSLLSGNQLVATTLPKNAVIRTDNITLSELKRIKRNLIQLKSSNRARELLKYLFDTDLFAKSSTNSI